MQGKIMRRLGGASLALGLAAGLATSLAGQKLDESFRKFDVDVMELPPQVQPPGPGDTDWPFYNRTIAGDRFSPLAQIDTGNVGQLQEVCRVRIAGAGPFSAGTLLANGMLYTTSASTTIALHPTTCDVVWKSIYNHDQAEIYNANRGVAHWSGKLFRGTGDGRLVAYDAMTGRELWRAVAGDHARAEYISAAPLAWEGMVFVGVAAGDLGIAGRLMAFDAQTGRKLWTFNLIPAPGEFGNETWPGDTWKTGGGGTWSSYTLDPETGELFIPVANPAPAFDAAIRKGANLFTNSALVLDARTGRYRWHYQARPNDNHDYGVTPPAILLEAGGRKLAAQASKDGFLYMIDRTSHNLVWKAPVTTIFNHDAEPTAAGVRVCPGAKGGVEYNSPGYDPQAGLLIAGAVDWCYHLATAPRVAYVPGAPYLGGKMDRGDPVGTGWFTAIDAKTGKVKWRFHTAAPVIGAITPTAGGVTFAGDAGGTLYAFRTADGAVLRKIDTGGAIAGGIITYRIGGRQFLAVGSGNISRSSWTGAAGIPTMIVYALPDAGKTAALLPPDAGRGRAVYAQACSACHGSEGQGGEGPALAGNPARLTHEAAVALIRDPASRDPAAKMPRLWPAPLGDQAVADVAAYVLSLPAR